MSQYAGYGMDMRIDHTTVHRLRIADMKKSIRCELAKFLDCGLTNWEILAEELSCHPTHIDWIKNRARHHPTYSPTMLFFDEYCTVQNINLPRLVRALHRIDHQACISVLRDIYGNEVIDTAFNADALCHQPVPAHYVYPQSDSTPQQQRDHSTDEADLWSQVEQIGSTFSTTNSRCSLLQLAQHNFIPGYCDNTNTGSQDQPLDLGQHGVSTVDRTVAVIKKSTSDYSNDKPLTIDLPNTHSVEPVNYHRNDQTKVCVKSLNEVTLEAEGKLIATGATAGAVTETTLQSNSSQLVGHSSIPCQSFPASSPGAVGSRNGERNGKHLTHPFSEKECQQFERAMIIKQKLAHSSTLMDVQQSVYTVDNRNVRVFVTYTVDSKAHRCHVLRLCECLKRNHFSVSLDARETHLLKERSEVEQWHNKRYSQADFVLVLISPLYCQIIQSNADHHETARNALHIYRRMMIEYKDSNQKCRFIAIVMPGSSKTDVPMWLRETGAVYDWPSEYLNLFYRMMSPATVVNNFLQKREKEPKLQAH